MDREKIRTVVNVALLLVGLVAILYLATKYGYIHCSALPHWCSIYSSINTALYGRVYPSVAVLYGDEGLGDPDYIVKYFREKCRMNVRGLDIDRVSLGNLQGYDVVVVERARYLTAAQLEMLWDFVAGGGKLVIIGDVGVEGPEEEYLTWKDLGEESREGIVNPWDRKRRDGVVVDFGASVLGLRYLGNGGSEGGFSGTVYFEDDILTRGFPRSMDLETAFAATEVLNSSVFGPVTVAAVIGDTKQVGDVKPPYPAIVRIGYRVFFIAYPPEEAGGRHALLYFNLCEVVT